VFLKPAEMMQYFLSWQKIHYTCSHSQKHHDIQVSPSPVLTCKAPKAPEVVELASAKLVENPSIPKA